MLVTRTVRILGLWCFVGALPLLAEEAPVSMPAGFLRVEIAGGGASKAVSLPWFAWDDSIQAILAHGMRGGTNGGAGDKALKFDPALPGYVRAVRVDTPDGTGVWVDDDATAAVSDMTLNPGEGIILQNNGAQSRTVYLAGEVMLEADFTIPVDAGINLISPPFAAPCTNELAGLNLGQAGWLYSEKNRKLKFTRPYANLFPADPDARLRIARLTPMEDGQGVTLGIRCTGVKDELLDIYGQDLETNGAFHAEGPWRALAVDLATKGQTNPFWSDDWGESPPYARVYLLARADIDADGDGIPDARQRFLSAQELARIKAMKAEGGRSLVSSGGRQALAATSVQTVGTGRIVYVDRVCGDDRFTGRVSVAVTGDGPKRSVKAGIFEAKTGDILVIRQGNYGEPLNVAGKGIAVKIEGHVDLTGNK